ncbi:hypothetical protein [Citrobacter pasteurii]|nr:hypothetical protein SF123566_8916 [Shigella flexneri 1235-66]CEJ65673.1 hypothetical protein [Citrobacter pasteurii]
MNKCLNIFLQATFITFRQTVNDHAKLQKPRKHWLQSVHQITY